MLTTCFGDRCAALWENPYHFSKPNVTFSQLCCWRF